MPSPPTSPRFHISILQSANTMHPHSLLSRPTPIPVSPPLYHQRNCLGKSSSIYLRTRIPLDSSSYCRRTISPLRSSSEVGSVVEPVLIVGEEESEFIEVGYIGSVHGIRGELKVKPNTDFPELRFTEPGRRWLRACVSGKETIQEVYLTGGRAHHGQKSWILSFSGIDTVDKAKQIVGSTILVREVDRPKLEDGEFYTLDLVGMRVVLKETGRPVGTVVRVVNYGASDLLQVLLNTTEESIDGTSPSRPTDPLVWVPFVEAIVPDIDMNKKVMQITPPRGLLELNLRSDMRSKKERRQLEWKQRKKFQQGVIAAKKKLCEIGQKHVLKGFLFGEKDQKGLLANEIIDINFRLFKHAVKSISMPFERCNLAQFINANSAILVENTLRISNECFTTSASKEKNDIHYEIQEKGLHLLSGCKVATVLVVGCKNNPSIEPDTSFPGKPASKFLELQEFLLENKRSVKMEKQHISLPLIVICPAHEIQSYQELMLDHDYFGFEMGKVWFVEEEKLPAVAISPTEHDTHNILLKSPWEILKLPMGSGGVYNLLSSQQLADDLTQMGIEYLQVCSLGKRGTIGNPLFIGLVNSRGVDVGIKIFGVGDKDDEFDIIFSMRYLSQITKQMDKLQFVAIAEKNECVDLVDKEWINMHPNAPNSYRLHCSIYSFLNSCSPENICVLQIVE